MNTYWDFLIKTWRSVDQNGSMTWRVYPNKLSILHYFNNENIDLEKILKCFNENARDFNLDQKGWKLPFEMKMTNSEVWDNDYFKRVEFICYK